MQPSTRHLEALPEPDQLRGLCQSIAVLDAILCPAWDKRYYSFNALWQPHEQMASMRNENGDEWYALFSPAGVVIKGSVRQPQAAPHRRTTPPIYNDLPPSLREFLQEPAFDVQNVSFVIWRESDADAWTARSIDRPGHPDPDGSVGMLAILDGEAHTYWSWAAEHFGVELELPLVEIVYEHGPLTLALIDQINPAADFGHLRTDILRIGYPADVEVFA